MRLNKLFSEVKMVSEKTGCKNNPMGHIYVGRRRPALTGSFPEEHVSSFRFPRPRPFMSHPLPRPFGDWSLIRRSGVQNGRRASKLLPPQKGDRESFSHAEGVGVGLGYTKPLR